MATKTWSSTAPPEEFKPYIDSERGVAGIYLAGDSARHTRWAFLRRGDGVCGPARRLTVSASIPIAVLSISILRAFGKVSILENNIVQTTGSAGESIAGGVIFTLPALIFLGFPLEYWGVFFLALIGGWLGVLFMIPLRRQLIVKEHGNLLYPEGTACADVLVAGDRGGSFASRVFWGLGLGGVVLAADEFDWRLARYADVRSEMAPWRVVSREHHAGISRRGLHHRPEGSPESLFRAACFRGWC